MSNKKSDSLTNKYTSEDLKIMQSWSLDRKIQVTQLRIAEWYEHYNGNVYISFSGGKDSTVLLDLARRAYPDIPAVFIDTGLEYPEIKEFVKTIPNVTRIKPEISFRKVIETYGYPIISKQISKIVLSAKRNPDCISAKYLKGEIEHTLYGGHGKWAYLIEAPFKVSNYCCDKMKKQPAKIYEKESGRKPIVATMACESQNRRAVWFQQGCNAFDSTKPISKPMSFWTEQDVLEYLKEYNIPYAPVYGQITQDKNGKLCTTGVNRTGCVFCAFGAHLEKEPNRFQRLKVTHPMLWEYCMKSWDEGGLGMKEVLDYINVKYQ